MELKGSKTEQNLLAAFGGESMAAMKYQFYGKQAKKDGYEQIKGYFEETAYNERAHAQRMFQFLSGVGTTEENLLAGANGEHDEWAKIYSEMADVAKSEGFVEISIFFQGIAKIEKEHEERYRALLQLIKDGKVFVGDETTVWICRHCGHIHVGKQPPQKCPVCLHPQAYFERKKENY